MDEAIRRLSREVVRDPSVAPALLAALARTSAGLAAALDAGVELVWVPPGVYPVGHDGRGLPGPLHHGSHPAPVPPPAPCLPSGRLALPGLFLAVQPLRGSVWERLERALPPGLHQLGRAGGAGDFEADPVIELRLDRAREAATRLGAALPLREEWEAAARGPEGLLYPWGPVVEREALTLERAAYELPHDTVEGTGYTIPSGDVVVRLVRSFGRLAAVPSPCGLLGLARAGREWNVTRGGGGWLRSLSNLADLRESQGPIPGEIVRGTYTGPTLAHLREAPPDGTGAVRLAVRPFGHPPAPVPPRLLSRVRRRLFGS